MSKELPADFEVRAFTRDEFNHLIEAGFFSHEDRRLELIHGRLVVVPSEGPLHASLSTEIRDRLVAAYGALGHVREAKPLDCGIEEQPEPDIAVVEGAARDYDARHPRGEEALLVVEVSRTTQARDREKSTIYAAARVPAYWLIDVTARRIEVHTDPIGERYGTVRIVGDGDELQLPSTELDVAVQDLLGRA